MFEAIGPHVSDRNLGDESKATMPHPFDTKPAPVRVLIVEDDPLAEAGERLILSGSGFDVVGVAHSVDEGVALTRTERPDVVVADVILQGLPHGLALTHRLAGDGTAAPAIVLRCAVDRPYFIARARSGGAAGYVPHTSSTERFRQAVRTAASGGTDYPPDVDPGTTRLRPPSPQEARTIRLLADGWANTAIAADLGLSEKTVETYLARMYARYDVECRTQLVVRAIEQGWIVIS